MIVVKLAFLLFSATAIALLCFNKSTLQPNRYKEKPAVQNKNLKQIMEELNGKVRKENYLSKSQNAALAIFEKTGQPDEYKRTINLAKILFAVGAVVGLILKNFPLTIVLASGGYFLPLWCSRFFLFRYNNFVSEELEVALSMITASYIRSNDIILSVSENIPHIKSPIRDAFGTFVNNVRYVSSNITAEIENLKEQIDNKLFFEWCDALILCQSDYTLKASLLPILEKFAKLKDQRLENETNMLLPMKEAITMILITISSIPLLYFINVEWFAYLINTFLGQIAMAIAAVIIFLTINKAILLSEPIEYDV